MEKESVMVHLLLVVLLFSVLSKVFYQDGPSSSKTPVHARNITV